MPSATHSLKVMTLAGGPDREREVSLMSGAQVTAALRQAGHDVIQRDIGPDDLSALDAFTDWAGDVIFPVLHGPWGEGGSLQGELEARGLRFVGCDAAVAAFCMDKHRTKQVLESQGLPTPPAQLVRRGTPGDRVAIRPPLVLKPPREGSSIDLVICRDAADLDAALADLFTRHATLLAEAYITGVEITVGVLRSGAEARALAPIQIVPAAGFYDYQAKYVRDDTRYLIGADAIDLPAAALDVIARHAVDAHRKLACRHLSRVDFMVEPTGRPWILEVNTMPGFTSHSLLPMAAAHEGIDLATLADALVRMA